MNLGDKIFWAVKVQEWLKLLIPSQEITEIRAFSSLHVEVYTTVEQVETNAKQLTKLQNVYTSSQATEGQYLGVLAKVEVVIHL